MPCFSQSIRAGGFTTTVPIYEIRTLSTTGRPRLLEFSYCMTNVQTSGAMCLGRTTTPGAGPTIPFLPEEELDGTTSVVGAVFWSPGRLPSVPTIFFRRGIVNVGGAGILWTFPTGVVFLATQSIVFVPSSTNSYDITAVVCD